MKTKLLLLLGLLAAGAVFCRVATSAPPAPSEAVPRSPAALDFTAELDSVEAGMRSLKAQLPLEAQLADGVVRECESIKALFAESFGNPKGPIDFILFAHHDPLHEMDFRGLGIDPDKSLRIVGRTVVSGRYGVVLVEGSVYDGFSIETRAQELFARLRYDKGDPMYARLKGYGYDPDSFVSVGSVLEGIARQDKLHDAWLSIEEKAAPTRFVGGESLELTSLAGEFVSGKVNATHRAEILDSLRRLRSAYVLAKAIRELKAHPGGRAAIVFGYLHEDDFRSLASALGIEARIVNATGVEWQKLRTMR